MHLNVIKDWNVSDCCRLIIMDGVWFFVVLIVSYAWCVWMWFGIGMWMTVTGAYGWTEYDFFIVLVEERFLLYIEFLRLYFLNFFWMRVRTGMWVNVAGPYLWICSVSFLLCNCRVILVLRNSVSCWFLCRILMLRRNLCAWMWIRSGMWVNVAGPVLMVFFIAPVPFLYWNFCQWLFYAGFFTCYLGNFDVLDGILEWNMSDVAGQYVWM